MTSREYSELLALARLEPLGYERTDTYAAASASVMGAGIKPEDFRYTADPDMSDDEIFHALSGFAQVVYGQESPGSLDRCPAAGPQTQAAGQQGSEKAGD